MQFICLFNLIYVPIRQVQTKTYPRQSGAKHLISVSSFIPLYATLALWFLRRRRVAHKRFRFANSCLNIITFQPRLLRLDKQQTRNNLMTPMWFMLSLLLFHFFLQIYYQCFYQSATIFCITIIFVLIKVEDRTRI